ncbi:MAG: ribosome silencing factor [Proteobacteria bacterium]|nr:ribosome silencing factor [Pseudomonadota bacterium]
MTSSREKSLRCVRAALEKKAYDLVLLDVQEISSFTAYFLICSGRSDRQVQAIARSIEDDLKRMGIRPLGMEGFEGGKWILMDYDDVLVHVFLDPVRKFYDLEGLWLDAPRVEKVEQEARRSSLGAKVRG